MKWWKAILQSAALLVFASQGTNGEQLPTTDVAPKVSEVPTRVLAQREEVAQLMELVRDDRRMLLAARQPRQLGLKKLVKKVGKSVGKLSKKALSEAKDAVKDIKKAFGGVKLPRDKSLEKAIMKGGSDAIKKLVQGSKSFVDYVDNQLVDDLEWLGNIIADAWLYACELPGVTIGLTYTCSYAMQAAVCAAAGGTPPFCTPLKLWATVLKMIDAAIARQMVRCAAYHGLKEIPGLCNGRAMGVADMLDDLYVGDPFTPPCQVLSNAVCLNDFPWTCGYEIDPFCTDEGWKAVAKIIAEIFD